MLDAAIPAPSLPAINPTGLHTWSHALLLRTNFTNLAESNTAVVAAGWRCGSDIRTGHLNPLYIDSRVDLMLVGFGPFPNPSHRGLSRDTTAASYPGR